MWADEPRFSAGYREIYTEQSRGLAYKLMKAHLVSILQLFDFISARSVVFVLKKRRVKVDWPCYNLTVTNHIITWPFNKFQKLVAGVWMGTTANQVKQSRIRSLRLCGPMAERKSVQTQE